MERKEGANTEKKGLVLESWLTKRAPDVWESARFQALSWLEADSGKRALSQPAQPPVTQAVGQQHLCTVIREMNLRRRILWIDGIAALLAGGLLLVAASWLEEWYNIFRETLFFIAVVNLAYGTYSLSIAMLNKRPIALIVMLVIANLLWSINCLRLAFLFRDTASIFGLTHLVGEAIFVGGLAFLEWRYRKLLQFG